ncbi:transcription factor bHLH18-like [Abrus precatorius]|uniref:Transcription factor bHLH18-like n=1 Tax=Abrus precatorius TaxID=3816 RepID=A0A8B8LYQ2_ABRPR|nr:transcription factor bHLH18-like [Abrus precatorius]
MDASAASWLSDLLFKETEDYNLFRQCHLNLLDDQEELLSSALHQPMSSESYSVSSYSETLSLRNSVSTDETSLERPTKHLKTNNSCWNSKPSSPPSSPTSQILSFHNPKQNKGFSVSPPQPRPRNVSKTRKYSTENPPKSQGRDKSPTHAQDHIMAERKRREKLSQSLIALAALIPGLKKMDKASVLGDAIKYVKELQERLRLLEEQSKNRDVESVVMVKKPQLSSEDHSDSRDDGGEKLPHVEARVSEKDVLLRIHCPKRKGLLLKILVEIQNLHLFVVNSSVLPFGDSILDITIVAQMGTGYNLTINDLVKNLRVATLKSMS